LSESRYRDGGPPFAEIAALSAAATLIVVCLFAHLGSIGLVGPDEPRYVWIARAMAETGDWVTPRLYGQGWFEKPALYYWAAGLGFLLHLPAEWAARLPSAMAALAAALGVGWLGFKHYDQGGVPRPRSPALVAPILFAASVAAIGFARAAAPDMLFSATITLAMASAACVLRRNGALRCTKDSEVGRSRGDRFPLILFGSFLGLSVLAKGPAGILLAAGALGLWAIATKQWRAALRGAHYLVILSFCIVALPWYIVCSLRNPSFLRVFLLQHNFERYLTPMFEHSQPFWYFVPVVLIALLPWTVLLWLAATEGLRIRRENSWRDSPGFFFACWAASPLIFFSLSQSKLPGYALPAIPPLALVLSVALVRAIGRRELSPGLAFAAIGGTWMSLGVAAYFALRRVGFGVGYGLPSHVASATAAWLAIVGVFLMVTAFFLERHILILLCALLVAASVEAASLRLLPALDPFYSARPHAQFMRNLAHPDRLFTYHLSRSWRYGLAFYFHRELPEWSPADVQPALVLTTPSGYSEIRSFNRCSGGLDEPYVGIFYVPVTPAPVLR
jgi:4-amino-4-deoxy-L-arabinose transferase-like glycosyltransferase